MGQAKLDHINAKLKKATEALYSEQFASNTTGYAKYIDVGSFIDYFLTSEISLNVDGYRLSTFLHYDPELGEHGMVKAGPQWDINLAYGNADYNYYDG
jgi:spore coat protein CotH